MELNRTKAKKRAPGGFIGTRPRLGRDKNSGEPTPQRIGGAVPTPALFEPGVPDEYGLRQGVYERVALHRADGAKEFARRPG